MTCDICQGIKRVRLPVHRDIDLDNVCDSLGLEPRVDDMWREFDCPACSMVPYKQVRAVTLYNTTDVKLNLEMPAKRALAAKFGVYLLAKGYLKFVAKPGGDFLKIAAGINVVSPEDGVRAEAVEDVAEVDAQVPLWRPKRPKYERTFDPPVDSFPRYNPVRDEFNPVLTTREKARAVRQRAEAAGDRFSGLDFDDDNDD